MTPINTHLALAARPDFAARVSQLIDEQRKLGQAKAPAHRTAKRLSRDEAMFAAKARSTKYFAATYPINYQESIPLKNTALRQWKATSQQRIAAGLRKIPGYHRVPGLVARLFRERALTPTMWGYVTSN